VGLHVFVVMPFGIKQGIDFNRIYGDLIQPALDDCGFEVFRADDEQAAGNIRADMFQELLLADLVVAELSIDNPNVWYELGVRHALRARGVVLIQSVRETQPFDIYTDRKLYYHLRKGAPDPDYLEQDRRALAEMARATVEAWHGKRESPVFYHLPNLEEPAWKKLRVGEAQKFWEMQAAWERHIEIARRKGRPGDILVLADEAPVSALRLEAYVTAARALRGLGRYAFALEQVERALKLNPDDLDSAREKGLLLGRLNKPEDAKTWLQDLAEKHPADAETNALLGRLLKDAWVAAWQRQGLTALDMRLEAAAEDGLLREAMEAYATGFRSNPSHFYSGINALTLMALLDHVNASSEYAAELQQLAGGVRWAVECALNRTPKDYWARVTAGDLEVLTGEKARVTQAYKAAVAVAQEDWFALNSSRDQLRLLKALDFRSEQVDAALRIFDRAQNKLKPPEMPPEPVRVFLSSGHMIDAPGRRPPRFPPEQASVAAEAIAAKLKALDAGVNDLALCSAACGNDLLFAEECLRRGLHLEIRLPFQEPAFLEKSVNFAGDVWRERFYAVKNHPHTQMFIMPDELGPDPPGVNAFEKNNLWQLYTALSRDPTKVHFLCLWNGATGDGPGGTAHMYAEVNKRTGQVHWLDTRTLWDVSQ
jgi:tetratricopeptide (TPR) repeat protein